MIPPAREAMLELPPASVSMTQLRRAGLGVVLLALAGQLLACRSDTGPPSVPDYAMRNRMRGVAPGQSLERVHEILGTDAVRKPRHPDHPFPSPLHAVDLTAPDGRRVRVETYVVAARPEEGCPDFRYEDRPVVFIDGVVAGTDWEYVEWNWRSWGGSLERLRALQDRLRCPETS